MIDIKNSLYNIKLIDSLAHKDTIIHRLHPLTKLITALAYIFALISFEKYDLINLFPFVFYPIIVFALADLPAVPIFKRLLIIEPFIIGMGIFNPILDQQSFIIGQLNISRGWITFAAILLKYNLTVIAGIQLVATTGIDKLSSALKILKLPKIIILQLLLIYRYITVLIEEVIRMQTAYVLRAPGHKGIHPKVWGSFAGQLILRTFDRAQMVYQAMSLRGFSGEYHTGYIQRFRITDFAYLAVCCTAFTASRIYNIPMLVGTLLTGVI